MMGRTGLLMRSMSSARSALGKTTPAMPAIAHMAISSRNHSVFAPLIRMRTGCSGETHAAALARDAALPSGGTASSRSMMTASAPLASAFANRSGRSPGTNKYDRAIITYLLCASLASRGADTRVCWPVAALRPGLIPGQGAPLVDACGQDTHVGACCALPDQCPDESGHGRHEIG